tara:strand:- start:1934 stop:2611 length:678 start_codon:yes stop_codon:yes gene_type:complete
MGATIATLAATAIQTVAGFKQSADSQRTARAAEADANLKFQKAEQELSKNYIKAVSLAKEPFEEQTKLLETIGTTRLQAIQEGDQRGALAAGGIGADLQALSNQQRAAKSQAIQELNLLTAQEDARLAGARAGINLDYAKGAQEKAAENRMLATAAQQQGLEGLAAFTAEGILNLPNLFGGKERDTSLDGVDLFEKMETPNLFMEKYKNPGDFTAFTSLTLDPND